MMSILPLYNVLALPGARMWLRKKDYTLLTGKEPVPEERVTLLMQREDEGRGDLSSGSFYPIAVSGVIFQICLAVVKPAFADRYIETFFLIIIISVLRVRIVHVHRDHGSGAVDPDLF